MKYKVHKKYLNAIIMLCVMPVAFFLPATVIYLNGFKYIELLLAVSAASVVVLIGWSIYVYTCLRPSAKVDGEKVIYYPLWKKKRVIDIALIDKRTVLSRMDMDTYTYRSLGKTIRNGSKYTYEYTYFIGEKEVMKISSDMKNAERFDSMIKGRLPAENEE